MSSQNAAPNTAPTNNQNAVQWPAFGMSVTTGSANSKAKFATTNMASFLVMLAERSRRAA